MWWINSLIKTLCVSCWTAYILQDDSRSVQYQVNTLGILHYVHWILWCIMSEYVVKLTFCMWMLQLKKKCWAYKFKSLIEWTPFLLPLVSRNRCFTDFQYPVLNSRSVSVCKYKGGMEKHNEKIQNACVLYLIVLWWLHQEDWMGEVCGAYGGK